VSSLSIVQQTEALGLIGAWSSRREVVEDVRRTLKSAKRRVWMAGIALNDPINFRDIASILRSKSGCDVRFLTLDGLCKDALIRSLVVNSPAEVGRLVAAMESKDFATPNSRLRTIVKSYKMLNPWKAFDNVRNQIDLCPAMSKAIRYYRRYPMGWIVIADDEFYWQPYTFGRREDSHAENAADVPVMPVISFADRRNSAPCRAIEDHFQNLWANSPQDQWYVTVRNEEREWTQLFAEHNIAEYCAAFHALYDKSMERRSDQRSLPRRACELSPPPVLGLNHTSKDVALICPRIIDQHRDGFCLEANGTLDEFAKDDVVTISNQTDYSGVDSQIQRGHSRVLTKYFEQHEHKYQIRHIDHSTGVIGLKGSKAPTTIHSGH